MKPGDTIHRSFRVGAVFVIRGMINPGVLLDKLLILLDRHFPGGDGKPAGNDPAVRKFVRGDPIRLGRRRAHAELDRAFDQRECLPLAVDQPAAVALFLGLEPRIDLFELRLLLPLTQRPRRRPVDAGVGIVLVEGEQPGDQGFALTRGEAGHAVSAQRQDQGPADRGFGVEEDGVHELRGGRRPAVVGRAGSGDPRPTFCCLGGV